MPIRSSALLLVLVALAWPAPPAAAQGIGIGPRWSFVKGEGPTDAPAIRFFGGTLRLPASKRIVLEVAADYRSQTSDDGLARLREVPIQGSVLFFPVRSRVAPYLLGGYGMYSQKAERLDASGAAVESFSARKTGGHFGFGVELFLSRNAAFFVDYRYRFVEFGEAADGAADLEIPGVSFIPGASQLDLNHRGTMWTSGMAFYF